MLRRHRVEHRFFRHHCAAIGLARQPQHDVELLFDGASAIAFWHDGGWHRLGGREQRRVFQIFVLVTFKGLHPTHMDNGKLWVCTR